MPTIPPIPCPPDRSTPIAWLFGILVVGCAVLFIATLAIGVYCFVTEVMR